MDRAIYLKISSHQVEELNKLVESDLSENDKLKIVKTLEGLWKEMIELWHKDNAEDSMKRSLFKMSKAFIFDRMLNEFYIRRSSIAAADLLLDPEPIEIEGSDNKMSLKFRVSLKNILAITSKGRKKNIYLKESIYSENGDGNKKYLVIKINKNKLKMKELLKTIQGSKMYFMLVSSSAAVNLKHYEFAEDVFILKSEELIKNYKELGKNDDGFQVSEIKKITVSEIIFDLKEYHLLMSDLEVLQRERNPDLSNIQNGIEFFEKEMKNLENVFLT